MKTNNAEVILSNLSTDAVQVLRTHFLSEAAATLTASLNAQAEPKAVRTPAATHKSPGKRQLSTDGTERNASQFIRDCAETMSANEVVEAGKAVGLDFASMLVYNVRAAAKKKSEKVEATEAAEKTEAKNKKAENLAKARAARAKKAEQAAE